MKPPLRRLRELGNDLNRGAYPANLAEQIWDACDDISRAIAENVAHGQREALEAALQGNEAEAAE